MARCGEFEQRGTAQQDAVDRRKASIGRKGRRDRRRPLRPAVEGVALERVIQLTIVPAGCLHWIEMVTVRASNDMNFAGGVNSVTLVGQS